MWTETIVIFYIQISYYLGIRDKEMFASFKDYGMKWNYTKLHSQKKTFSLINFNCSIFLANSIFEIVFILPDKFVFLLFQTTYRHLWKTWQRLMQRFAFTHSTVCIILSSIVIFSQFSFVFIFLGARLYVSNTVVRW